MVDPSTLNLKNPFLAGLLGLVIGPLGLFYTTIPGALMLLAITAGLVWSGLGIVLPLIWVASATIGFGAALRHNARVMLAAMAQAGEGS